MRTKQGVDSLNFDDLYNNLRVFESDVKGSTTSSSSSQNVAFVSSESTNSTNDVSTAYVDLEQLNEFDLEEIDLKWQVAMISMRLKKFYKKSGRKIHFDANEPVGFDKTKVECYNCHKTGHFTRKCRSKENQDNKRRDVWNSGYKAKDNGRRSGKQEEPNALVTLDGKEAQLVGYQQNQLWYEEKIKFMKVDLDDKTDVLTYHKKLLAEALKEKDELKPNHRYGSILSYENEVLQSVFMNKESDVENKPLYDRFVSAEGMHAVPPPMTGNYMPSGPDIEIDYSKFTYDPKQSETSESNESNSKTSEYTTCDSDSSNSTPKVVIEPMPKPAVIEPKVDDPHKALKNKGIVDSGCSRHMTGNKAYLADYQDYNGGPVVFGGSKGHITSKGKQHKVSCKAKSMSSISQPLQLLHMDLFGPTSVRSINHKTYCLVITDDFSRFSWVFFLRTKDETSAILKDFIRQIENRLNNKVKTIRCDNGTEFKNRDIIEFCGSKGIKREYSNARTPQQNGVAERKNRTLIEAARTMLADSFLPNTFWAE
ncbi:ribonuclease H-like domain-containing protein [Tanacetum coccineum]